jgi:hypothetical protein
MKIYFSAFILSLIVLACQNEPTGIDKPQYILIYGKWLWVQSSGGFGGQIITPPSGTKFIDTYTSSGFFYRSRNDTVMLTSRYRIETQEPGNKRAYDLIIYDNTGMIGQAIMYLSPDTLRLCDTYFDGFSSLSIRVNNNMDMPAVSPVK